jgi:IS30 family transposase
MEGLSFRKIAKLLGRSPSSISREIARNYTSRYEYNTYYPHTAHKKYLFRRRFCHRGMFGNEKLVEYITEKLQATWSPEQIANTPCELKMPCHKTIYRWLYEGYVAKGNLKVLRKKGKTRKRLGNGGRFTTGKSIRKRDKSVYKRKEFGHWEADTVVSGQGKSKTCFATLAERKTRLYLAMKIPDKKASTMAAAVISMLSAYPSELVKSITCDRGAEFANWQTIEEKLHCNVYFADPYCAWQKGTNENSNGLLREFYPKGRNLSRVSPKTLLRNLALINARPRKCLKYISAQDSWDAELKKFF